MEPQDSQQNSQPNSQQEPQPPPMNPYTKALQNALEQIHAESTSVMLGEDAIIVDERVAKGEPELDISKSQFLANMIQGRFLQYMVSRITDHYHITDKDLEKQMTITFMQLLTNKFFNVFREKVTAKPQIVYKMALKIVEFETKRHAGTQRLDGLFMWLGKTYFAYHNFDVIFKWVNRSPEVEKIIFLSDLQRKVDDPAFLRTINFILENDKEGVTPMVFNRYLKKGRVKRLMQIVRTGEWKMEADLVSRDIAKRVAWNTYVKAF